jgi:hypothetical protein
MLGELGIPLTFRHRRRVLASNVGLTIAGTSAHRDAHGWIHAMN